ncbi:MAG: short-chain dehydrogenase [Actinobacteria bacterium 69-20]|jgi:NAD(P)-dependent dehydrogenase (short-subunit alcohol dehydrogenase family)|nr:SDR family oxidoreductase [Actinomycetota bacterium]OJV23182.1 MAG: short-chain dehydrogenase [Actinobacteria bacterium 69-20]
MTTVVIGGTAGIGLEFARSRAAAGRAVVISGRDADRANKAAADIGARAVIVDLADPKSIAGALAGVGNVDELVLLAIDRDSNSVKGYDIDRAIGLTTIKLVSYIETVHTLLPRMTPDAAVVLFGGRAKDKPYPGSTTVSTINGGVIGMVNTLAIELAPIRVNAIHPGIVGDSPYWAAKPVELLDGYRARTPTGVLATMADVVDAIDFLLRNKSMNGQQIGIDGGWMLT